MLTYEMTCQAAQTLLIGDEVEIAILAVEEGQVSLGITAPADRRLMRIDPVPLPKEASDMRLRGLGRALGWSRGTSG